MPEPCPICNDLGLRPIERDGVRYMQPCTCRVQRRAAKMLATAHIPRRYEH